MYGPPRPFRLVEVNPNMLVCPSRFSDRAPLPAAVAETRRRMREYTRAGRFDWLAHEILEVATTKPQLWLAVARAENADRVRTAARARAALQRALDSRRRLRLKKFRAKRSARRAAERKRMKRYHLPRAIALKDVGM